MTRPWRMAMVPKRVALLIETSTSWGSQIIAGVSDYVRRHERWMLYLDHRGVFEAPSLPSWWEGEGVIARVTTPALARDLRELRVPAVNVSQIRVPGGHIQQVTTNERTVGELAAESLISAGLRSFAYYGPPRREHYIDRVAESFFAALRRAGHEAASSTFDPDALLRSDTTPHLNLRKLVEWLRSLPKPVGILAWNTLGAHRVSEACCWAELPVPESVSILAGDHDHLVAEIATPQVTCIDHAPRRVGYLAAAELARLMTGGARVREPVLVEPAGVVHRESVCSAALADELVAQAVEFIRANAARDIAVEDVLAAVPASRRGLEIRFHRALGRGPAAEIRRVRLTTARDLLAESRLPIKEVALRCGFTSVERLQRALRAETSLTPTQYRELHHRRPNRGTMPPHVASLHDATADPSPAVAAR